MTVRLKNFLKHIIYSFVNIFVFKQKMINPTTLLLIRMDGIGDYILFRNFIEVLKQSATYRDFRITLCGNMIWRDLSEELDGKWVDKFIWIDRNKFTSNLLYRYRKLREISSCGYEVAIHCTYSRDYYCSDMIMDMVNSTEKIGSIGDFSNIEPWEKSVSDNFYTKLLPAKTDILFEYYRNREFFEILLEQRLSIKRPSIYFSTNPRPPNLPNGYVLLFIGASHQNKKWATNRFSEVALHIHNKHHLEVVLCGGMSDTNDAKDIIRQYGNNVHNLVGETTLLELLTIISHASQIISNDSCVPHMAVALGTVPVIVISNNNSFGRFLPYPPEITKNCCHISDLTLNLITTDRVVSEIDKLFEGVTSND